MTSAGRRREDPKDKSRHAPVRSHRCAQTRAALLSTELETLAAVIRQEKHQQKSMQNKKTKTNLSLWMHDTVVYIEK